MRFAVLALLIACRPSLSFKPDTLPDGTVGQPYHAKLEVLGGETPIGNVYTESPMPPGLTLAYDKDKRDGTATIAGTPTVAGRTSITIEAWAYGTNRAGQKGKESYEIVIR